MDKEFNFFRDRFIRKATKRLTAIVNDYVKKTNKRRKSKTPISRDHCDLVGVHIRRTDHLEFEQLNNVAPLTGRYFLRAMEVQLFSSQ